LLRSILWTLGIKKTEMGRSLADAQLLAGRGKGKGRV